MNARQFASLGSSAFAVVVAKRQAHEAASHRVTAVMDADPCDRVCRCERRPLYDAAVRAEAAAYDALRTAETAWDDYCQIRYEKTA